MAEDTNMGTIVERSFHFRDGIHFERTVDGDVWIDLPHVEGRDDGIVRVPDSPRRSVVIPADSWASILACMSRRGETAETWAEARRFHGQAEAERAAAGRDAGAALRLTLREYLDRRDGHLRAHFYAALKAVPCIDDDERGRLAREAVATAAGDWERDLPPSILAWLDTAQVDVPEAGRDE